MRQENRSDTFQRALWPRRRSGPTLSYAFDFPHFVSRQILTADLDNLDNDNRLPAVLNAHANLVVRGRTVGPELKEAFQKFLIAVEESWENQANDLTDPAHFGFWHHPKDSL